VAFVRVALPLDEVEEQLAVLRRIIWGTAVLTAALAMALAFWLARRITRPIQELTAGAQRIAAGEFGQQVYALGHDEPAVLARAFNAMSEHLARQFAQLDEDRQQLWTVLSGMVEGVVALDAQQRILFANERASELLGIPLSASAGRHFWEVVRQRPLLEMLQRAMIHPESQRRELNPSDGRSLTVYLARLQGSLDRGAVLVLHDTTELRRLERLRQEFVANVSHELKTPLAVIKAAVETLIDGAIDDPEHRGAFLDQVAEQAERLHSLILDLLSLARIESGTEAFERGPVPLGPAVADCLERHRGRAEAKNLTLLSLPGAADHLAAWADEEAIGQIIDNLVDNAIKYTPPGGQVCVRWYADNGQVVLEVEDTGIGIPERDLPRVFERFYRVDKTRSRELGGTGLGLSIVKHLAQAMDGSVDARSTVGQGSTFIVRLPLAT
jgi:two-component system phosphate regulon sensor histidine kinase PhoR